MYVHQKTCIKLFIAALFKIAPNWKQLKYPPMAKRTNILCCIHTLDNSTKCWTKEVRAKSTCCIIPVSWSSKTGKLIWQQKSGRCLFLGCTVIRRVPSGVLTLFCFLRQVLCCGMFILWEFIYLSTYLSVCFFMFQVIGKSSTSENGFIQKAAGHLILSLLSYWRPTEVECQASLPQTVSQSFLLICVLTSSNPRVEPRTSTLSFLWFWC